MSGPVVHSGDRPLGEHAPARIGEYILLGSIGQGAMGDVYRAVHGRLNRIVAIKVLAGHRLADADAAARFKREMRAVGKLSHPNIVAATDAGQAGRASYLAMEYVDGMDLARLLKRHGRLPAADACEVVRQAARGLQYVHEHGLVHRDLKPSNLLLTLASEQPAGGLVKVADLGLALACDVDGAQSGTLSMNLVLGSLDYMAPEQADDAHHVDHRADLYSLGCTLYDLLSGHPPFCAVGAQSRLQKIAAHAESPVPSLAEVCPNVPASLERIVRRLLAKKPRWRFSSAGELAAALAPFCAGADLARLLDPATPATAPLPLRPAAPHRRKRWKPVALALACTGALAAAIFFIPFSRGTLDTGNVTDETNVAVQQDVKPVQPSPLQLPFNAAAAKRSQTEWCRHLSVEPALTNSLGMELAFIPPGEHDHSGSRVTIGQPFYLAVHEVTVGQFREFAEASGYKSTLEAEGRGMLHLKTWQEVAGLTWRHADLAPADDYPVAGITWIDADRFCAWLSEREQQRYRLPTDAEWEWAARSGSAASFAWGNAVERIGDYEWYNDNSDGHSHPVGQRLPNAWGLYDMNGNLTEWSLNWRPKRDLPPGTTDLPGLDPFHGTSLLLGGAFWDPPNPLHGRGCYTGDHSMEHVGFRVCREL